ncbi:MAG: bifunctional DNA-formamidopyrimidine glycosylase/DNA-(apurinic or apyrimidinic site) lyase [Wolbachia endosymbiont of Tyrophagus putrescentiae]|nr:bifunctional DNA-formamidopyrimidine glycosylase/DNA-(apurinic or apyrimidinic site) lyase [Wolbachia endosymbiont of Tyrophagus putrescentiae]
MPELPEVEVICNFLRNEIKNKQISGVVVNCCNLRAPVTEGINEILQGKIITEITRRGKYIIWSTNSEMSVIIHLGMSGKLVYNKRQGKHDHVVFFFSDHNSIVFNDPRRFGLIIVLNREQVINFFSNLGVEPLTDKFNAGYLHELLKSRKANIKSVLMDNKLIVGVGNIYASESLFRARISPLRQAKDLGYSECVKLTDEVKNTLKDAITAGGSTFRDYMQPSGSIGHFQNNFYVYGRDKKPCKTCHNTIKLIRQNGRSTYFCEICQN